MKKFLLALQFVLFSCFLITAVFAVFEVTGNAFFFRKLNHPTPGISRAEEFDPSLARINSLKELEKYVDSLHGEKVHSADPLTKNYALVASQVVRKRFYHGYSNYGFGNNYVALFGEPILKMQISAVVIPDDILKFPYGACSQQSVVLMEFLRSKGYPVRKVGFSSNRLGGHFCFETFYDGAWHFSDPDLEPNRPFLIKYNNPDIKYLNDHPDVLAEAYKGKLSAEDAKEMFGSYYYGQVNKFPAPNAIIYQRVTKFLSYTFWVFFLAAFIFVRRKYLRLSTTNVRNRRFSFPFLHRKRSVSHYPESPASRA